MERLIDGVQDSQLQEALWRAINGRRPFRVFKDILLDYPDERQQWFDFENEHTRQRIVEWLEAEGIEPTEASEEQAA